MNKKYNIRYNAIPEQNLRFANQLTVHQWNEIINILRVQTNLSSEYIEKLHLWLIGSNSNSILPKTSELKYGDTVIEYDGIIDYIFSYLNLNNKLIADNKDALDKHVEDFDKHKAEFVDFKTVYNNHVVEFNTHTAEFASHVEEFRTHVIAYNSLETRVTNTESAISDLDARLGTAENTIDKLPDTYVPKDWGTLDPVLQNLSNDAYILINIDGAIKRTTFGYFKNVFIEHTESHYRGNVNSVQNLSSIKNPQPGDYAFVVVPAEDPTFERHTLIMYIWNSLRRVWQKTEVEQYASFESLEALRTGLISGTTVPARASSATNFIDTLGNTHNIGDEFNNRSVSLTVREDPSEDTEKTFREMEINGSKWKIPSADFVFRDFVSPSTTKELKEIGINGTFWKVSSEINLDDIPTNGVIDLSYVPSSWEGTTVPASGYVHKVYINTFMSKEEVEMCLDRISDSEYIYGIGLFVNALTGDVSDGIIIMKTKGTGNAGTFNYQILVMSIDSPHVVYNDGWEDKYTGALYEFHIDTDVTGFFLGMTTSNSNDLLSDLFSITPFEKVQHDERVLYRVHTSGTPVKGAPIPYEGMLDIKDVFINTNLSIPEVEKILNTLKFSPCPLDPFDLCYVPAYGTLEGDTIPLLVIVKSSQTGLYVILLAGEFPLFANAAFPEAGIETSGWNVENLDFLNTLSKTLGAVTVAPSIDSEVTIDGGVTMPPMERQNEKLQDLIFVPPFEFKDVQYTLYHYKNGMHALTPQTEVISLPFNYTIDESKNAILDPYTVFRLQSVFNKIDLRNYTSVHFRARISNPSVSSEFCFPLTINKIRINNTQTVTLSAAIVTQDLDSDGALESTGFVLTHTFNDSVTPQINNITFNLLTTTNLLTLLQNTLVTFTLSK